MTRDPLKELNELLSRLPGIGERSAQRLGYYMVKNSPDYPLALAATLQDVAREVRTCSICQGLTHQDPCPTCQSQKRQREVICVVSHPQDIAAIEASGEHQGLYHVLHGVLAPLDGVGPDALHVKQLLQRLPGDPAVQEIIVATPASVEGEATALYLAGLIRPLGIKVSRIASGLPMGGEIEFADKLTLGRAIDGRQPI